MHDEWLRSLRRFLRKHLGYRLLLEIVPRGEQLDHRLEDTGLRTFDSIAAEHHEVFRDQRLLAVGQFRSDEVQGIEAIVAIGRDLLAAHVGFGLTDTSDAPCFCFGDLADARGLTMTC